MLEYSRQALDAFIRVVDTLPDGDQVTYYGGDQAWFETENGRAGGCGTVAAANLLAYYGVVFSGARVSRRNRPAFESRVIGKDAFNAHMHAVYDRLTPWIPPWKRIGGLGGRQDRGDRQGKPRRRSKLPDSLGIHSPVRFAGAVEAMAQDGGVPLKAIWPSGKWPASHSLSAQQAGAFIRGQIEKGAPVAMLNLNNPGLKGLTCESPGSGRKFMTNGFQWHWVIVTGIETEARSGAVTLIVSSWGSRARLDLNAFWGRGLTHLVSFERAR